MEASNNDWADNFFAFSQRTCSEGFHNAMYIYIYAITSAIHWKYNYNFHFLCYIVYIVLILIKHKVPCWYTI